MPSSRRQTCWPNQFFVKWLAVLFGSLLVGIALGAMFYHKPAPQPVQIHLEAFVRYSDGVTRPVPAEMVAGGSGAQAVRGANLATTSTDENNLTPISRTPGSRQWFIFRWNGMQIERLIEWPHSTNTQRIYFDVDSPSPRQKKK